MYREAVIDASSTSELPTNNFTTIITFCIQQGMTATLSYEVCPSSQPQQHTNFISSSTQFPYLNADIVKCGHIFIIVILQQHSSLSFSKDVIMFYHSDLTNNQKMLVMGHSNMCAIPIAIFSFRVSFFKKEPFQLQYFMPFLRIRL